MFTVQEVQEIRGSSPARVNMLGITGMMHREAFLPRKLSTDYLSSIPRSLLHPQTPPDSTSGSPIVKPEGMCFFATGLIFPVKGYKSTRLGTANMFR